MTPMEEISALQFRFSSTVLYSLILSTITLWYAYFRISRRRLYELADKIDGPSGLPFVGCALGFIYSAHTSFKIAYERSLEFEFGVPIKLWIGPKLVVILTDPRDIEVILSSNVYIDKSPDYQLFQPWLGDGLLISTGDKWKAHRKLIAPTFHLSVLRSFISTFNANSKQVVKKFEELGSTEFDCHEYMSAATVEILLETAMGVDKNIQGTDAFEYALAVMKMCDILHMRHRQIWFRPEIIFRITKYAKAQNRFLNIIHNLTNKVMDVKKIDYEIKKKQMLNESKNQVQFSVNEIIQKSTKETILCNVFTENEATELEIEWGNSYGQHSGLKDDLDVEDIIGEKKRSAFLDSLMENAKNGTCITDKEVREQVDTIMFEGHDTTAAASSFFLCIMGLRQDIQNKVIEELNSIFGDSDRDVTFEDTLKMKYMERCIMETLRIYPPVPMIARQTKEEVTLSSNGCILPANCTVVIGTFKLHRNPKVYENPNVFNPDNFLPEKSSTRHYYSYIPFSAGPRSCVGRKYAMLKLKILLSTILRNFRIINNRKEEDWQLQIDIILKRTDGFNIILEPRHKKSTSITPSTCPSV